MTATTILAIFAGLLVLVGLLILHLKMKEVPPELIGPWEDADGNPIQTQPKNRKSYVVTVNYFQQKEGVKVPGTEWFVTASYTWDAQGKRIFHLIGQPTNLPSHTTVEAYVKSSVRRLSPEILILGQMWVDNAITEIPTRVDGKLVTVVG